MNWFAINTSLMMSVFSSFLVSAELGAKLCYDKKSR